MRRALDRLSSEQFDLLIIGGGATGCFAAREAALRGLSVALIEAKDFAGATSAHNSKLAHGGLRYLRNGEIGLVRESLRERAALLTIAPHLVRPLSFLLPLYGTGWRERLTLNIGLSLYDFLAAGPRPKLPNHHFLSHDDALAAEPVLAGPGFKGAFAYYDAQMYSPERIALECVIDADAHGAAIANHLHAENLILRQGKVLGASVQDTLDSARFDIQAAITLIAAGPWSDLFLEAATGKPASHRLLRSKGIHLVLPPRTRAHALTVEAGSGHFFVMPWRGYTLLGTTDSEYRGDPSAVAVTETDIADLLGTANRYLPSAHFKRDEVLFAYAGLRPLVADGGGSSYGVSRRAELVDHRTDGLDGLFSGLGGKWTTSRQLAETMVTRFAETLGRTVPPSRSAATPLPGGRFEDFDGLARGFEKTWPGIATLRHLAHMQGARLPSLLKGAKLADLAPLGHSLDTMAQVDFAVAEEMALTLEDVVMRRTSLGQFGRPAALERVADRMAARLSWDAGRRQREIDAVLRVFTING